MSLSSPILPFLILIIVFNVVVVIIILFIQYFACFCFLVIFFFQVLLLIDASFGFEMEVFEFLSICQIHGFPKIIGVLTHLDLLKDNKGLRKTKKRLKNRFWMEVYQVPY